jgi:hypothetical protein
MTWNRTRRALAAAALMSLATASLVHAKADPQEAGGLGKLLAPSAAPTGDRKGRTATPAAIPDIYGPGAVLTVGSVVMKVTNYGLIGNPFTNISSDPSGQWPGASGVEYVNFILLAVGGVNPTATDPNAVRRVSYIPEWWPPTPDPEDRMYRAYDGIINGSRLVNDDSDINQFTGEPSIDEDFLDGRDNDGDGRIDEDYAALGQLMFSCVMRDDTPAAFASSTAEAHVPLVVEVRQLAWAYSVPGFTDFNVVQWDVYNRSGHTLDSMYFGIRVDVDAGPASSSTYFSDDQDLPFFPNGEFVLPVAPDDPRFQLVTQPSGLADTLCPEMRIRVQGFSVCDNDGDEGRTPGVASLLLFGHTVDPLGLRAPQRVGFRAFRSFVAGTPYASNGNPSTDQQRFEFLSSRQNISGETGFIGAEPGDQQADYTAWSSVGPFLNVPDGGMITCTIGFAVAPGAYQQMLRYPLDYASYQNGLLSLDDLFETYPALENAFTAQVAYEGVYELPRPGFTEQVPDCGGCETGVKLPLGSTPTVLVEQCPDREAAPKQVTDNAYTWFDFDCDPCTGVWNQGTGQGYYLRHWNAESPPPSPNLNVASTYNYTDNPNRVVAGGDGQITLAWDNVSETTPDPKSGQFDFRAYRVWKVAGWQRPVGASGPNDEDWALMAEFRMFDYMDSNFTRDPGTDTLICPMVFVPNYEYPIGHPHCTDPLANPLQLSSGGCRDSATVKICLRSGDFWDRQSGFVLRPQPVDCVRDTLDQCVQDSGLAVGTPFQIKRTRYPVGRYVMADREVKNGFVYFYSVTAGDSTAGSQLFGRRAAVESDYVTPQSGTSTSKSVWVVPNPYRGFRNIQERPSSWDLTPNATDPTGTHVDFMGLPSGQWKIRIYTVSGDLVAELHDDDSVNESVRGSVTGGDGVVRPGYNRQQDHPGDGQARWNLISRNGQDVVSGIYLFVVDSDLGQQRGKFVVIR